MVRMNLDSRETLLIECPRKLSGRMKEMAGELEEAGVLVIRRTNRKMLLYRGPDYVPLPKEPEDPSASNPVEEEEAKEDTEEDAKEEAKEDEEDIPNSPGPA
mmetsp:Transcript_264/g.816  ORF Transcript_264/g.816 Transcript_264/m.816 type:complete len:102 (-) Transcript_264:444-749(-)